MTAALNLDDTPLTPWEAAARRFEQPQQRPRRWDTPGQLAMELDDRMVQTPALDLIDQALVDLAEGREQRLMVFAPPQEGKSERCSRFYPLWLLSHNPDLRIAIVSYDSDTASRWGWQLRLDIQTYDGTEGLTDLGLRLHDRPAQKFFRIAGHHGMIYTTGVGGSLTGRPVDCLRGDTLIVAEHGQVPIRDLCRPDAAPTRVLSFNHHTGQAEWRRIVATRAIADRPLAEVVTAAGRRVVCTPDHRFHVPGRGYVPAVDLCPGQRLLTTASGVGADTVSVVRQLRGERDTVYDLQVEGNRNFFAGGVLVHNCLIIDDPIKDMEQANSTTYRERAWRFWQAVAIPRLGPESRCLLIQTRWHEDDLAGRLLEREGDKAKGGVWKVLSIPAKCEDPATDPLGRQEGEYMLSARGRTEADWKQREKDVGAYVWAALFQQRPAPAEGGLFKGIWWRYWTPAAEHRLDLAGRMVDLRDCWRFGTVDLAASERTSADWTVISAWARTPDGDLILLDRHRSRVGEEQHFAQARPLVERWRLDTLFVEKSQQGYTLVREATQAGIPISPLDAETDKMTRALPASAWCSAGRIWLPAGVTWLTDWVEEHRGFPNARHDDQVDTLAYAVRVAITRWAPLGNTATGHYAPQQVIADSAVEHAAFGDEIDPMTVPL